MRTTIVGGAMLPHAAQFSTQPDTEDKDAVARVKQVAAEIGTTLKALEPNLWIIFATDDAIGIPLTRLGVSAPVPPIYVNAYLPPQPTPERCYAFGQAVARCVSAMGLRTVVLASGGMSHFPGAERYGNPALDWDEKVLARIAEGNLKSLAGYDEADLDETGNVELRCWACAADMLGGRKPDVVSMEPSWHHDYASLGWFEA